MSDGGLHRLVAALTRQFDEVIGPVVADGVIRLRPITSARDLPVGVSDEREPATYRLGTTGTARHVSDALGPVSLESIVHPPRSPVGTMRRRDGSIIVDQSPPTPTTCAVNGVRARRAGRFIITVDCTDPSATCSCDSAGVARAADLGYDVALTELVDDVLCPGCGAVSVLDTVSSPGGVAP